MLSESYLPSSTASVAVSTTQGNVIRDDKGEMVGVGEHTDFMSLPTCCFAGDNHDSITKRSGVN